MPTFTKEPDGSFSEATRKAIVEELRRLDDEYSKEKHPVSHREHLGVSVISDDCSRHLWYGFRWVKLEDFKGRMRRLFKRGHTEETNFIDMFLWMGFFIREIDPDTKKQYQFSKLGGHYGGSSDSLALLPWFRDNEADKILIEYKTHNAKSFKAFQDKGLKVSKPKHFAQMSCYGREFKTRYGLYCALNKDTDEYDYEFIELDWQYAAQLENKARDIITAKLPPPRISDQPSYYACKYCDHHGICHHGEPVEINCRSCKFADPIDNAEWYCNRYKNVIPKDFIKKGCDGHVSITS